MNTIHIQEEEPSHGIDTKSSQSQDKTKAHMAQNVTFGTNDDEEEESSFASDTSGDESDFSVLNKKHTIK